MLNKYLLGESSKNTFKKKKSLYSKKLHVFTYNYFRKTVLQLSVGETNSEEISVESGVEFGHESSADVPVGVIWKVVRFESCEADGEQVGHLNLKHGKPSKTSCSTDTDSSLYRTDDLRKTQNFEIQFKYCHPYCSSS